MFAIIIVNGNPANPVVGAEPTVSSGQDNTTIPFVIGGDGNTLSGSGMLFLNANDYVQVSYLFNGNANIATGNTNASRGGSSNQINIFLLHT